MMKEQNENSSPEKIVKIYYYSFLFNFSEIKYFSKKIFFSIHLQQEIFLKILNFNRQSKIIHQKL